MPHKPKILVVENDEAALRQLEVTLRAMGAEPHCLDKSKQAAERINREKFDGAFLDWDTPELNGEQLTKLIRNSRSNSRIPIAMITEHTDTRAIARGFELGATFFLSKPLGPKELTRLLNASRGAMLEERRRYQRAPVKVPASCSWDDKRVSGQTVDVSAGGLQLTLPQTPAVGAEVLVEFTLPRVQPRFRLQATVVRVSADKRIGLKFSDATAEQRELLKGFTDRQLGTLP